LVFRHADQRRPAPGSAGTSQSFNISGLSSGRTYYFALKTSDETNNISPLSNVVSAGTTSTNDITPPAAVTNLTVVSMTTSSAKLSWTAPGDDGDAGTAKSYDVRYYTTLITTSSWASAKQRAANRRLPWPELRNHSRSADFLPPARTTSR